jgi:hypothetical protein
MVKALAYGDVYRALLLAEQWKDSPQVRACIEDELHVKAAVLPGTSTGATWAGATAFDVLTQEAYKCQTICVLSQELLKLGDPSADRTVRETVAAGVGAYLDSQLLTNTVTLSANVRPASICNGATAVTSKGAPLSAQRCRAGLSYALSPAASCQRHHRAPHPNTTPAIARTCELSSSNSSASVNTMRR